MTVFPWQRTSNGRGRCSFRSRGKRLTLSVVRGCRPTVNRGVQQPLLIKLTWFRLIVTQMVSVITLTRTWRWVIVFKSSLTQPIIRRSQMTTSVGEGLLCSHTSLSVPFRSWRLIWSGIYPTVVGVRQIGEIVKNLRVSGYPLASGVVSRPIMAYFLSHFTVIPPSEAGIEEPFVSPASDVSS